MALTCDHKPCVYQPEPIIPDLFTLRRPLCGGGIDLECVLAGWPAHNLFGELLCGELLWQHVLAIELGVSGAAVLITQIAGLFEVRCAQLIVCANTITINVGNTQIIAADTAV